MASSYPTSLDAFTNPTSGDNLDSPDHATQHADVNDAVEALEAKVGTGSGTPTTGRVLKGGGTAGSSEWADDVPVSDGTLSVGDLVKVKSLSPLVVEGTASGTYVQARDLASGYYYGTPTASLTTGSLSTGVLIATPFVLETETTFDRIAAEVTATAASAVGRLGVYASGATAVPDTLEFEAGTVDASSSVGVKTITISQTLTPGLYWLALLSETAAATWRTITGSTQFAASQGPSSLNVGFYRSGVSSGALPASFGATTTLGLGAVRVMLRTA